MPYFETDCEVHVDVDEFLNACNPREIKELIETLKEDGHLSNVTPLLPEHKRTLMDDEWFKTLERLSVSRLTMSEEDIQTIKTISNKY